jgi:transposase InsO family protein
MRLATREVRLLGVTDAANQQWATQCCRALTDPFENSFIDGVEHVIMDNDPIFGSAMQKCFTSQGIVVHQTAKSQPWMNGYIERFIGTTRNELRPWFIPFSGAGLEHVLREHVRYYNHERTHRATPGQRPPRPLHDKFSKTDGEVIKVSRLGNRLNSYVRMAA